MDVPFDNSSSLKFCLFQDNVCTYYLFIIPDETFFCFQSPNSVIRYEIDKSNTLANKFFSIDHNKGIISLSQPLINDQDLTEEYEVQDNADV